MKINEIMTSNVRCITPETNLAFAAEIMRDLDVGALPVCEEGRLIGVVTDRDIAIRGVAEARDPERTPVRDVMSSEIVYATEDQDVEDAARLMEVKQIRRLPVLDEEKHLSGIVSLGDIATESGIQLSGEALREISRSAPMMARRS